MSSRVRHPETTTLHISQGDWLLVKKHLNAGEQRRIFSRMYKANGVEIEPLQAGLSQVAEYLLDWNITDANDKPIMIRDQSAEAIIAAVESLDPEDYTEINKAIDTHHEAMRAARAKEKNDRAGEKNVSAISPSPSAAAGASSGSVN